MKFTPHAMLAAAAIAIAVPTAATAQDTVNDVGSSTSVQQEDDQDFPWGLLGLLGLAGLLGRKRDNDVRVDSVNRR